MEKKNGGKKRALFGVLLSLVLVIFYSGLRVLESTVFTHPQEEPAETIITKTINRNGANYFPRQDIMVMMLLGIDQTGPMEDSGSYRNSGAADVVMLVTFDEKAETYSILYLNRDTMVEMPVLGLGGKKAGTTYGQLALAYSYGSGLEESCENVRETVSNFLYGLHIDYYLSMNMEAIGILNDAVGGVTVNIIDDFSEVDPGIAMGTVTLNREQAVRFIRARKDVGDQLNLTRMERQKEYMRGFSEALMQKMQESDTFLMEVYDQIGPYSVTDCTSRTLTSLVDRFRNYTLDRILSPAGKNIRGEEYIEYYVDEEALDKLILELFYAPKK